MGDRGNIVIRSSESNRDDVWFYTHWSGSELKPTVQRALAKRWRWTDSSYLARIVFDELTAGDQGHETGFGISTQMQDNEYDILVIDTKKKLVYEIPESLLIDFRVPDGYKPPDNSRSFDAFVVNQP